MSISIRGTKWERDRERHFIDKLIRASVANRYHSVKPSNLHITENDCSYLKILEVRELKIEFQIETEPPFSIRY
jgi:hypothetical protein